MASRLAIISRHVVLLKCPPRRHPRPVFAAVLVEEEIVVDIILADTNCSVEDLMEQYRDWNPVDCSDLYVSPGLVDINVRRNRDWEGVDSLTQAAVSGGVTLVVEELAQEQAHSDCEAATSRYCDTAYIAVVDSTLPEAGEVRDCLALKAYLTPPDGTVGGLFNFAEWMRSAATLELPIILDAAVVDPKVLFLASPCRLVPLQQRRNTREFPEHRMFGGAFSADVVSDDSASGEEGDLPSPSTWKRQYALITARRLSHSGSVPHRRGEARLQTLGHIPDFTQTVHKDIHSALEEKITEHSEKLESLCKAEMLSYQGVGQTTFEVPQASSEGSIELPSKHCMLKSRKRPPALTLGAATKREADTVYIKQLAHYPDNIEARGVKRIVNALRTVSCHVHIANVSSAKAVTMIQKAKEEKLAITCETCPHFLFFADHLIADGDTRLKNFPPIRNKANCNFLWELIKMNSIDAICSQHVPVSDEFKFKPSFKKAVPGICGMGFTLQALWTILKSPCTDLGSAEHYIVRVAKWTALNPAKVVQVANRGAIEKGFYADFTVWDPFEEVNISHSFSAQSSQCPYLDKTLYGRIHKVFVRGHLAFADGEMMPVGRTISRQERKQLG